MLDDILDYLFGGDGKSRQTDIKNRKPRKPNNVTQALTDQEIMAIPREDGIRDQQRYLSLRQPWAWLVLKGFKDIENRSRRSHHRGELFIHASSNKQDLLEDIVFVEKEHGIKIPQNDLQFGALLGSVIMVDCVEAHESVWFSGPFGHVVCEPRMIDPIKMKANAEMQRTGEIDIVYLDHSSQ